MSLKRRFSLDSSVCLEGVCPIRDKRRSGRKSLDEARQQIQALNQSLPASPFPREQTIAEESFEGTDVNSNILIKHKSFHKLFPEIPEGESLTQSFSCALQKDGLFQGKLFVSENHVSFHSTVLLKVTKVVIPVLTVREVRKHHHSAMSLTIQTADGEKYLFVSLMNRGMCYKLLQSVCSNAQAESTNSSPQASSGENDVEFDMVSSNSSMDDSFDGSRQSSVNYDDFSQYSSEVHLRLNSQSENTVTAEHNRGWMRRMSERMTSLLYVNEIRNIQVLFYAYIILMLLLLLASGYIGMRIVALEEYLISMGSIAQTLQQAQYLETSAAQ